MRQLRIIQVSPSGFQVQEKRFWQWKNLVSNIYPSLADARLAMQRLDKYEKDEKEMRRKFPRVAETGFVDAYGKWHSTHDGPACY